MRIRNRATQVGFPDYRCETKGPGSKAANNSFLTFSDDTEHMEDRVNPGYFTALKSGGLLPVSPMWKSSMSTQVILGTVNLSATWKNGSTVIPDWAYCRGEAVFGQFQTTAFKSPGRLSINKPALLQSALASAQTNAFDMLTFAAEFNKTVEMFATAWSRYAAHLRKVLNQAQRNAARSGSKGTAGRDFFAEAWLEWRFGLRPVLHDIEALQELLRRLAEGSPVLSRGWTTESVSAQTSSASKTSEISCYSYQGAGTRLRWMLATAGTYSEEARTWVRTVTGRASVGVEVTTRDLTLADPVLSLWELTPFSVFIDYFVQIGDLLAAFSPFATGKLAFATYTETVTDVKTETVKPGAAPSRDLRWVGGSTPSTVIRTEEVTIRSLEQVVPNISFNPQLDVSRVLDLVALIWVLRRKVFRVIKLLST